MEKEKLVITTRKYRGESMVLSARLTVELVKRLDEIAHQTGRTRNEILQLCIEYGVDNMEIR